MKDADQVGTLDIELRIIASSQARFPHLLKRLPHKPHLSGAASHCHCHPVHQARVGDLFMKYLHTMVRVTDIDRSLDFYVNKLGLKEIRRMESPAGRFTLIYLAAWG